MRILDYVMNLFTILIVTYIKTSKATNSIHICESEDPAFLGEYAVSRETMDGVHVYSNANDMSFYRNKGFWYIGNLAPWPPETHYRCVEQEGCNYNGNFPPTSTEGEWKGVKSFGKTRGPLISSTPCDGGNEEL